MNAFTIYLWGIADGAKSAAGYLAFISTAFYAVVLISGFFSIFDKVPESVPDNSTSKEDLATHRSAITTTAKRVLARSMWAFLIPLFFVTLSTLLPDSKTIACMVIIPRIAESEAIQRDGPDMFRAAKDALVESFKERGKFNPTQKP